MNFKKILSLTLTFLLIFSAFTLPTLAAGKDVSLKVSSALAKSEDTVEIEISIDDNSGYSVMSFSLIYDSEALTLTEYRESEIFKDNDIKNFPKKGYIKFINYNGNGDKNIYDEGVYVTLIFKVNKKAEVGNYPLKIKNYYPEVYGENLESSFVDQSGKQLSVSATHGAVTVEKEEDGSQDIQKPPTVSQPQNPEQNGNLPQAPQTQNGQKPIDENPIDQSTEQNPTETDNKENDTEQDENIFTLIFGSKGKEGILSLAIAQLKNAYTEIPWLLPVRAVILFLILI